MDKSEHPMQPLILDEDGIVRFKHNSVVRFLLDTSSFDMNKLWRMLGSGIFSIEDMEQFYQLIGYSVSGFGEMSHFRAETVSKADELADEMRQRQPE